MKAQIIRVKLATSPIVYKLLSTTPFGDLENRILVPVQETEESDVMLFPVDRLMATDGTAAHPKWKSLTAVLAKRA